MGAAPVAGARHLQEGTDLMPSTEQLVEEYADLIGLDSQELQDHDIRAVVFFERVCGHLREFASKVETAQVSR
jgi:hypothetical protein